MKPTTTDFVSQKVNSFEDSLVTSGINKMERLWKHASAPFRPSSSGLSVYKSKLKDYSEPCSLVLGATPELIDLLIRAQSSPFVMDICIDTWQAIQSFSCENWRDVQWRQGDWTNPICDFKEKFDYICCDGGTLFLDWPRDWSRLLKVVFSYLKPGGIFVTKVQDMGCYTKSYQEIFHDHIDNFESIRQNCEDEVEQFKKMISSLHVALFLGTNNTDNTMNMTVASERIAWALSQLLYRYNEEQFQPYINIFFMEMDPLVNPRAVLKASPKKSEVLSLFDKTGFKTEYISLPKQHAPGPDVCYMLAAQKK